jgi:PTH1 family peptidyl-tRNA hydrolase
MLVVHDDIDLAFGRLKIIEKGGHGGHKGVKSLIGAFGGNRFVRVRIGVGRSDYGKEVVDHVLGNFGSSETEQLQTLIDRARDAITIAIRQGTTKAMNRFNQRENSSLKQKQ